MNLRNYGLGEVFFLGYVAVSVFVAWVVLLSILADRCCDAEHIRDAAPDGIQGGSHRLPTLIGKA
jgi:hypothetical protein